MMEDHAQLLGRYQILNEIGKGGFASVYRALDLTLGREVALKVMHPVLLSDPTFAQRFRREAKALAYLRHAHIITIHDVVETEGRFFIIMELANGPSLSRWIEEKRHLSWRLVLGIMKPVCEALDYAHRQGVIHRDLKPSNILLDMERGALLSDFGMARLVTGDSGSISMSGGIMGTPAYIAPELWDLEPASPQSDIYSLGCIVFEMLTGKLLFSGTTPMQIMRAHDKEPRFEGSWPGDAPQGIEGVLRKAVAHNPKDRYASARDFWEALKALNTTIPHKKALEDTAEVRVKKAAARPPIESGSAFNAPAAEPVVAPAGQPKVVESPARVETAAPIPNVGGQPPAQAVGQKGAAVQSPTGSTLKDLSSIFQAKSTEPKSESLTLLLAFVLGYFGIHRFYTGHLITGFLYLITLGFLGYGVIFDILMILLRKFKDGQGNPLKPMGKTARTAAILVFIVYVIISIILYINTYQNL